MSLIEVPPRYLLRRRFLQLSGLTSMGLILGACRSAPLDNLVSKTFEPINEKVESLIFNPQKPVPEFPVTAIEPNALIINSFNDSPIIDPLTFKLKVYGEVDHEVNLSLSDLQKMPLTSMVIRHICVEGWSAIVQWGGVRLRDIISLVQPKPAARYVYFYSADGYYESWDIDSALHPQTLMVYQKNGAPLPIENGAPLRLAAPIKLGYKQSKWVTKIKLVSKLTKKKGYWEDRGYEWFGGL